MRKLLASLLFIPCMASAEFMTGNNLHGKMNGDFGDKMLALGFIQGVFDVYVSVTFCSPSNVTVGQVSDMVRSYLDNNPSTEKPLKAWRFSHTSSFSTLNDPNQDPSGVSS